MTGTTSSPRRRGRRKQCSPLTRKKTGTARRAHGAQGTHTYDAPLCACASRAVLISEDCRPNSPAGWLVRPYGGRRRAGGWWGRKTVNGARAHSTQPIGNEAWGGKSSGDVDGRKREGLTGPGLPSSLTRGLSSSREAVRLSFLRFAVPRSRSRSQDNCKSAE